MKKRFAIVTVCGSCVHFDRETGTAHGFCKTQTQMRVSAESPSAEGLSRATLCRADQPAKAMNR